MADSGGERLEQLAAELRRAGIKLTQQRLEILRAVAAAPDHPNAETVFRHARARVPSVSLDTVYRTLWLLVDLGLVDAFAAARDRVRFDANPRSHHHFICTNCGLVRDFYSPELDELPIPNAVRDLGLPRTTHVEVKGLCTSCARDPGVARGNPASRETT